MLEDARSPEATIELCCLAIVAGLAQCLIVGFVPEQFRIATVRFDVVNAGCLHVEPSTFSVHFEWIGAERMLLEVEA